jgi:F-type H+-transporting ATPase subunit b
MEFFKSTVSLGEVFVQLLAFLIVFWVLKALAWNKILAALEARRIRIKTELEQIESAKKEVENLRVEYADHLQTIDQETRKKLQEAVAQGKRAAQEIQEEARKSSREILEKAKEDIGLEVAKARVTLRDEIVNLTLAATEQMLEKKVDAAQDKEMVLELIKKLEQSK